ncbi:hypothetical protein [Kitasatospora sp. NPDC093806]|uniref:hypothetical protein n=1 Tax=Kitasatospora sp. NPDC093806 TaxID=3155075 RepID=UPI00342F1943
MKLAVRSALSAALPLLALVPLLTGAAGPIHPAEPTTDATCSTVAHGTFATAVAPGGVNTPIANTLDMTGAITCVDGAGAPLATGTFERTISMQDSVCTGDQNGLTSVTTVKWSDGTISNLSFDRVDVQKVAGIASLVVSGRVTDNSARFAFDTIKGAGSSTGTGCGTPLGETAVDSTLVLRLTH